MKPLVVLAFCIFLCGCGSGVMIPSYGLKSDGFPAFYPDDYPALCFSITPDTVGPLTVNFALDSLEPVTGMDFNVFIADSNGMTIDELKRTAVFFYGGEFDQHAWNGDTGMIDLRQLPDSFMTRDPMSNSLTLYYLMPKDTAKFLHVSATIRTLKNGKENFHRYEVDFKLVYIESTGGGIGKIFCENANNKNVTPSSKNRPSAPRIKNNYFSWRAPA
jgi:hypothetical protein